MGSRGFTAASCVLRPFGSRQLFLGGVQSWRHEVSLMSVILEGPLDVGFDAVLSLPAEPTFRPHFGAHAIGAIGDFVMMDRFNTINDSQCCLGSAFSKGLGIAALEIHSQVQFGELHVNLLDELEEVQTQSVQTIVAPHVEKLESVQGSPHYQLGDVTSIRSDEKT